MLIYAHLNIRMPLNVIFIEQCSTFRINYEFKYVHLLLLAFYLFYFKRFPAYEHLNGYYLI